MSIRERRGSAGSLAGELSFQWDARNVTPAAILEAETTWRNTLGAQQVRRVKQRSKSTSAAVAFTRDMPPIAAKRKVVVSFWGMVFRELNWGSNFQRAHGPPHTPSGHIANFMSVPLRMERFVAFGHVVALDLFLFHFTWLPLRVLTSALLGILAIFRTLSPSSLWSIIAPQIVCCSRACGSTRRTSDIPFVFGHSQQYDVLKAIIIVVSTLVLGSVQLGRLYHYIRGEATIKLYVFFNILSVLDTLAGSFGQDVLDALLRVTRDTAGDILSVDITALKQSKELVGPGTRKRRRQMLLQLAFYTILAIVYVTLHASVIFVQSVCLNVAINSRGNALLPLLVSSNFMELKSSVFKRYEAEQLFQISCSDAVERFVLSLHLMLVVLQQAPSSWSDLISLIMTVAVIWVFEITVDFVKHSFITKFNRLSADLYGTFSSIVAHDLLSVRARLPTSLDPTHASARRLGLATLPLACVVLRIALTHFLPAWWSRGTTLAGVLAALLTVASLWAAKLLCSMCLLLYSARVVRRQKEQLAVAVARQERRERLTKTRDARVDEPAVQRVSPTPEATPTPTTVLPVTRPATLDLARAVSIGSSYLRLVSHPSPSAYTRVSTRISCEAVSVVRGTDDGCTVSSSHKSLEAASMLLPSPVSASAHDVQQPPLSQRTQLHSTSPLYDPASTRALFGQGTSARPPMDAMVDSIASDESTYLDPITPAEQSLMMIGPLSQVERYSLTGRPITM